VSQPRLWSDPPDPLPGREGVVYDTLVGLEVGPVTLVGTAGVGTTSAALAAASRLVADGRVGRRVAVRMDATTRAADVTRAIGLAVDALLPGDEVSVQEALRLGPGTAVVLDDGDLAPEAVEHAVSLGPRCAWIVTGRSPVVGTAIQVPPLPSHVIATLLPPGVPPEPCRGLPLLTVLPGRSTPDRPWAAVDAFPASSLVADLPMGLPGPADDVHPLFLRSLPDRAVVRRAIREVLDAPLVPTATALSTALDRRGDELRRLAFDVGAPTDSDDVPLYRAAALTVPEAHAAALAGCAAARVLMAYFQVSEALGLVRSLLARRDLDLPVARGLLRWVEADALLIQGAEERAQLAHLDAVHAFRQAEATRPLSLLVRRCADRWSARGHPTRAREWLGLARELLVSDPDPVGLADTLRISAELSAAAGEHGGATALYDEALATLSRTSAGQHLRASVHLGRASLAIAAANPTEAARILDEVDPRAHEDDLLGAGLAFRRAEIALRSIDIEVATSHHSVAMAGFRRAGCLRGVILAMVMDGDLAALTGHRREAAQAYRTAISLCTRTRDLVQLRRVLQRALAVEREGAPGSHVEGLREHLDMVELLGTTSPR